MANYGHLQAPVLSKIFKTFCCNFYGSPIWDFNSTRFRKICTTWNIEVRTVLKLPFDTHCYFLGPLLRQNHIRHQLQGRGIRFLYNMYHSIVLIFKAGGGECPLLHNPHIQIIMIWWLWAAIN